MFGSTSCLLDVKLNIFAIWVWLAAQEGFPLPSSASCLSWVIGIFWVMQRMAWAPSKSVYLMSSWNGTSLSSGSVLLGPAVAPSAAPAAASPASPSAFWSALVPGGELDVSEITNINNLVDLYGELLEKYKNISLWPVQHKPLACAFISNTKMVQGVKMPSEKGQGPIYPTVNLLLLMAWWHMIPGYQQLWYMYWLSSPTIYQPRHKKVNTSRYENHRFADHGRQNTRLVGTKSLSDPMVEYCQLDP